MNEPSRGDHEARETTQVNTQPLFSVPAKVVQMGFLEGIINQVDAYQGEKEYKDLF